MSEPETPAPKGKAKAAPTLAPLAAVPLNPGPPAPLAPSAGFAPLAAPPVAVAPAGASSSGGVVAGNLLGSVEPAFAEVEATAESKVYWTLVGDRCPLNAVSFGGITFHRKNYQYNYNDNSDAGHYMRIGQLQRLTDRQIAQAKDDMRTRVLRRHYKIHEGKRIQVGQTDVALVHWANPGDRNANGELIADKAGVPIKVRTLVANVYTRQPHPDSAEGQRAMVTDEPWADHVKVIPYDRRTRAVHEMTDGDPLARERFDVLAEAQQLNDEQAAEADAERLQNDPLGRSLLAAYNKRASLGSGATGGVMAVV